MASDSNNTDRTQDDLPSSEPRPALYAQLALEADRFFEHQASLLRSTRAVQHPQGQATHRACECSGQGYYEATHSMATPSDEQWSWQCHLCGYHNTLSFSARDLRNTPPWTLYSQMICQNPSNSIVRSNNSNSYSRVHPNNVTCGHERCRWCLDFDQDMNLVRFSSGRGVSQEQYEHFWGWRHWAATQGLPSGQVSYEEYEEFCGEWFGATPTLPPMLPLNHNEEQPGEEDPVYDFGEGGDGQRAEGQDTLDHAE